MYVVHISHIECAGATATFTSFYFAYMKNLKCAQLADPGLRVSAGMGPCQCTEVSHLVVLYHLLIQGFLMFFHLFGRIMFLKYTDYERNKYMKISSTQRPFGLGTPGFLGLPSFP